jgi:small subunit ribosomal protein S16
MLRIRLSMGGVRKRPVYKIVIADGRYPRDGKFIEKIGSYNPLLPKDKKERIKIEAERVKYWMSKGAQPTLRVSRLLGELQIMPMPKPGNNPQKAIPKKDRKKSAEESKEAPKAEAKKEEPKAEAKKEEPKAEAKKEEPKAEAKKEEPKAEAKKEEPKAEAKKEEPKAEAKKEEPKAEAKKEEPKDKK